jgi:hypothetical protein
MVAEHGAQGRISGKGVCDGCRLILSAAVRGVKLSKRIEGIPPVVLGRANKWFWIVGVVEGANLRVWKVLNLGELQTRVDSILFRGVRVMLQGSMNLPVCQWVLERTVRTR